MSAHPTDEWVEIPIAFPEPGRTAPFRIAGRDLLLCNVDGVPYVLDDRCSHARTALAAGRLCGFVLECPLHGGKIDVRDGSPAAPPVRRPVVTWPARRIDDRIEIARCAADPASR
jgi:naphthalene 1,2-dioxygenase system ferredoxin subunit